MSRETYLAPVAVLVLRPVSPLMFRRAKSKPDKDAGSVNATRLGTTCNPDA